jgi:hypothetical protein
MTEYIMYMQYIYKVSVSAGWEQQFMPYGMQFTLQRQSRHLKGRMLYRRKFRTSYIIFVSFLYLPKSQKFRFHDVVYY